MPVFSTFNDLDVAYMREACWLCDRSSLAVRTGCVLVSEGNIVGRGWNGVSIDLGDFDPSLKSALAKLEVPHAELVCLNEAIKFNTSLSDGALYVSRFPCPVCAQEIIRFGIKRLFFMSDHFSSNNRALPLLLSAGVSVTQIPEESVWKNYGN